MSKRCKTAADFCGARGTVWANAAAQIAHGKAPTPRNAAEEWNAKRRARLAAGQTELTPEDRVRQGQRP